MFLFLLLIACNRDQVINSDDVLNISLMKFQTIEVNDASKIIAQGISGMLQDASNREFLKSELVNNKLNEKQLLLIILYD